MVVAISSNTTHAQGSKVDPALFTWQQIGDKFDNPVYLTGANDNSGRLFVVEQAGRIWIIQNGSTIQTPFLDLSARLPDEVFRGGYTERGLLGLAFAPDYTTNGLFYVFYTREDAANGAINVLSEFRVSSEPNRADLTSERILLSFPHPNMNHNGGMLTFDSDGLLYIGLGDGGGEQGDLSGYAQSDSTIFGKLLRLNPATWTITDAVTADDPRLTALIVGKGLRNPWRFSLDKSTGDLFLADVGLGNYEEINIVQSVQLNGVPVNFGWNIYEGKNKRLTDQTDPGELITPVVEYTHENGLCAAVGGYIYRGSRLTLLYGVYLYADYCTGQIWTLQSDGSGGWINAPFIATGAQITSFGQDDAGELYMLNYKGYVSRLRYK